jgi:hypothetical protein
MNSMPATILVEADTAGCINATAQAMTFVDAAAAAIKGVLSGDDLEFGLMPYRHGGTEYLSFDWGDAEKNGASIIFYASPDAGPLPLDINPVGECVGVQSWIDALLLIELIAMKVKGDCVGNV